MANLTFFSSAVSVLFDTNALLQMTGRIHCLRADETYSAIKIKHISIPVSVYDVSIKGDTIKI